MKSAKPANTAQNEQAAESGSDAKRSSQRQQLILAMLQHPTLEKAAASIGISKATAWRMRQTPEFRQEYMEARREIVLHSLARLQHGSTAAVSALLKIVGDTGNSASSRVQAASLILDYAKDTLEVADLEYRIARLEQMAGRPGGIQDVHEQTHRVAIEPYTEPPNP